MLNDFTGADKVYIACGYTDLRKGIDGLARLVQQQFELNPFTNTLFLFCGRRRDRIKGLYWEKDGCTAPAAAQNRLLCCMSTSPREKRSTLNISCKASQAGHTQTATRDTTDCRGTSVWWAVGHMRGENLTRHWAPCRKRNGKMLPRPWASGIAHSFSSWSRHWRS